MLFFGVFLRESARTAAKSRTNLSTAKGPIGPKVAPPSVFHGHNFYLNDAGSNYCWIVSGDISNCSYELSVLPLTSAHLSSAWQTFFRWKPPKTGYLSGVINAFDLPKIDWSIASAHSNWDSYSTGMIFGGSFCDPSSILMAVGDFILFFTLFFTTNNIIF